MLKRYRIDLKNLSPATTYKFDYTLDNEFFECVDGPEVRKGKVNVQFSLWRVLDTFELDFRMNGVITVDCDRCLEDMEIPVETINRLIVTFGEMYTETSDERIVVSEEDGYIDIAWYMYEFIALAIPIKHVHNPGDCNGEMASKLRQHCVDEISDEDEASGIHAVDPRWDALRNLMEEN